MIGNKKLYILIMSQIQQILIMEFLRVQFQANTFILFMNDLHLFSNMCSIILFADDTNIILNKKILIILIH